MHTSIFCRALSLHIFLGQGMAKNMPQAMKNPQIQSRIRQLPLPYPDAARRQLRHRVKFRRARARQISASPRR